VLQKAYPGIFSSSILTKSRRKAPHSCEVMKAALPLGSPSLHQSHSRSLRLVAVRSRHLPKNRRISPPLPPRASLILYRNEHHISTCRWYFPIGTVLSFIFTVVLENKEYTTIIGKS